MIFCYLVPSASEGASKNDHRCYNRICPPTSQDPCLRLAMAAATMRPMATVDLGQCVCNTVDMPRRPASAMPLVPTARLLQSTYTCLNNSILIEAVASSCTRSRRSKYLRLTGTGTKTWLSRSRLESPSQILHASHKLNQKQRVKILLLHQLVMTLRPVILSPHCLVRYSEMIDLQLSSRSSSGRLYQPIGNFYSFLPVRRHGQTPFFSSLPSSLP